MEDDDAEFHHKARSLFCYSGFHRNLINKVLECYKLCDLLELCPNVVAAMAKGTKLDINVNRDEAFKSLQERYPGKFQISKNGKIEFSDDHPLRNAPTVKVDNPHDDPLTRLTFDAMGLGKNIGDQFLEHKVTWGMINELMQEGDRYFMKQMAETNTTPLQSEMRNVTFSACEKRNPGLFIISENGLIDWNPEMLEVSEPNLSNMDKYSKNELNEMDPMTRCLMVQVKKYMEEMKDDSDEDESSEETDSEEDSEVENSSEGNNNAPILLFLLAPLILIYFFYSDYFQSSEYSSLLRNSSVFNWMQ